MPSGSHGGGGGSHSSGGSSFGGGRSSSSSSSSRGNITLSPIRVRTRLGGYVYVNFPSSIIIIAFFVFMSIISLFGCLFGNLQDNKELLNKIETNYTYYQNMISYAEEHPEYTTSATVTDKFFLSKADKWYITYEFETSSGSNIVEGYTFAVYTFEEVSNFHIGDTIIIAVNSYPITDLTDSITMDYKYKTLQDNGEYVETLNNIKGCYFGGAISGVVAVALIALQVVIIVKTIKKAQKTATASQTSSSRSTNGSAPSNLFNTCDYCGGALNKNATKCPSCGARIIK